MPTLKIDNFGGLVPLMSKQLLDDNKATVAVNTEMYSGEIRPILDASNVVAPLRSCALLKTIYNLNGVWLSWCDDVDVIQGFVPGDTTFRFYYTGDGLPKVSNFGMALGVPPYPSSAFVLGVSAPASALTATLAVMGPGTSRATNYVYTYVTAFGEESGPSPPSNQLICNDGSTVNLSAMVMATPPYFDNINRMRIYRAVTGTTFTEYLLVKEIAYFSAVAVDNVLDQDLGEALITEGWIPPPPNLAGLNVSPNGFASGFVGNQVYYSEPYQIHTWPKAYRKIFDYPVVACKWFGNTQVVTTTGLTYLVSGVDPRSMTVAKLPDPYPNLSKRSLVSFDNGAMYASQSGLVFVGAGGLQVITRGIVRQQEWAKYNPSTINATVYDGKYYGFYAFDVHNPHAGAAFVYDINDRATGVDTRDEFTDLEEFGTALFSSPIITMHFIRPDNLLYKWQGATTYKVFTWRSKEFLLPFLNNFGAARIQNDFDCRTFTPDRYIKFRLYAGCTLRYERLLNHSEPFRLPRFFEKIVYSVEIEGNVAIKQIAMASSVQELAQYRGSTYGGYNSSGAAGFGNVQ